MITLMLITTLIFQNGFDPKCGQPPAGIAPTLMNYLELNDGLQFGTSTHTDVLINIDVRRYAAISAFTYPSSPNFRRRIDFVTPPTSHNKAGVSTISISECAGDFTNKAACVKKVQPFQSMKFSNNPNDNPLLYCILEPGQTYYMNVINTPEPYSIAPSCLDGKTVCAVFYTETVQ